MTRPGRRFLEATSGDVHDATRRELYEKAREQEIPGRSRMNKQELADAVGES